MVAIDRKGSFLIWGYLLLLTLLEVGVVFVPGISAGMLISSLVLMAVAKAALVCLYYMHLNHETSGLKWTIAVPMLTPGLYAVVLVLEATYRMVA